MRDTRVTSCPQRYRGEEHPRLILYNFFLSRNTFKANSTRLIKYTYISSGLRKDPSIPENFSPAAASRFTYIFHQFRKFARLPPSANFSFFLLASDYKLRFDCQCQCVRISSSGGALALAKTRRIRTYPDEEEPSSGFSLTVPSEPSLVSFFNFVSLVGRKIFVVMPGRQKCGRGTQVIQELHRGSPSKIGTAPIFFSAYFRRRMRILMQDSPYAKDLSVAILVARLKFQLSSSVYHHHLYCVRLRAFYYSFRCDG